MCDLNSQVVHAPQGVPATLRRRLAMRRLLRQQSHRVRLSALPALVWRVAKQSCWHPAAARAQQQTTTPDHTGRQASSTAAGMALCIHPAIGVTQLHLLGFCENLSRNLGCIGLPISVQCTLLHSHRPSGRESTGAERGLCSRRREGRTWGAPSYMVSHSIAEGRVSISLRREAWRGRSRRI